jgi:hypothetical protein
MFPNQNIHKYTWTSPEVELAIEKLKRHKSPGIYQILAIKGGVEQIALKSINLLILIGISRNCLGTGRSQTICLSIRRVIKTECSYYGGKLLLSTTYKILCNIF